MKIKNTIGKIVILTKYTYFYIFTIFTIYTFTFLININLKMIRNFYIRQNGIGTILKIYSTT